MGDATPDPTRPGHKRSRSAVLKSLVMPSSRTPSPTKGSPSKGHSRGQTVDLGAPSGPPRLSKDHSVLGERNLNRFPPSRSPQKRSSRDRDEDNLDYRGYSMSPSKRRQTPREKENTTPPKSALPESRPPIWAQFSRQSTEEVPKSPGRTLSSKDPECPSTAGPDLAARPSLSTDAKDFAASQHSTSSSNASKGQAGQRIWDGYSSRPSSKSSASSMGSDTVGKVAAAVAKFNGKTCDTTKPSTYKQEELDAAFEAVLNKRNIPEKMRETMRKLDPTIKADFIRHSSEEDPKAVEQTPNRGSVWNTLKRGRARSTARKDGPDQDSSSSPSKRDRSRGRTVAVNDTQGSSPTKQGRSNSRPRSLFSLKNLSSTSVNKTGLDGTSESKEGPLSPRSGDNIDPFRKPADFVDYLRNTPKIENVEVGKLHKLRLLLRNESVSWVDTFVIKDGMKQLISLLHTLKAIEWRSEHDDLLLHEALLCLKALCTTQRAIDKLDEAAPTLFPELLAMLFDDERRGPSEFNTRGVVINLLFIHLANSSPEARLDRANEILAYLADPKPPQSERPPDFVLGMTRKRPYQRWCKEVTNVVKEVFWIFIHYTNVISLPSELEIQSAAEVPTIPYQERHFPKTRPPEALNPWVGGVEWEATNYLAAHLDLINGLVASLPTKEERNQVREEMKVSGFERTLGSLRLCKEKFYPAPHEVMREWVGAAAEDGWVVDDVRMGVQAVESASPTKTSSKENKPAPKLDLPNFELGGDGKL